MRRWPPDHYGTHAFVGGRRSYLLVQWKRVTNGRGIQLVLHGKRIVQIGFRP